MRPSGRRPRRILLGFVEVAGYYTSLAAALRELGVDATFVQLVDHPFTYRSERPMWLVRCAGVAARRRAGVPVEARARRLLWLGAEGLLRAGIMVWALARFDAFVFGFGMTFLARPRFELPLMRLLGKRVIAVYHGSDSRPPYLDGSVMANDRGRSMADCIRLTGVTKARVALFDRHADWVVENPLTSHFHERACVNWLAVGIPISTRDDGAAEERPAPHTDDPGRPVRILHSPSHPEAKGSVRIQQAIDALRARGFDLDFVQITGRPHAEVLRELARCDLVVDQLYSDTPMAGFATEAAHFGKPAVVGSYGVEEIRRTVPAAQLPPTELCHPDDVERAIERLVLDRDHRLELGRRARDFVRSRWAPSAVAQRYLRILRDDVPAEWMFDPAEVRHLHGSGLSEERVSAHVSGLVAAGGPAALCVSDKPELERRLLALADDRGTGTSTRRASELQQAGR